MHGRIFLAGVAMLLLAGCAEKAEPVPQVAPPLVEVPAASAGGACRLLDFAVIEERTGVRFDIAAASEHDDSHTCVVRSQRASFPELTLTVTETSVDVPTFTADLVPDGARKVSGLGRSAYRRTMAPARKHGPAAEVGWLSTEGRLATLRYTYQPKADRASAEKLTTKLVGLAKEVDTKAV